MTIASETILIDIFDGPTYSDFRRCCTTYPEGFNLTTTDATRTPFGAAVETFAAKISESVPGLDLHDGGLWESFESACRTYRAFRATGNDAEHSACCDAFDEMLQRQAGTLTAQRRNMVA